MYCKTDKHTMDRLSYYDRISSGKPDRSEHHAKIMHVQLQLLYWAVTINEDTPLWNIFPAAPKG